MTTEKQAELQELIVAFYANKLEADSYKKIVDNYNTAIKDIMLKEQTPEFITTEGIKATCTTAVKETFVEDALIAKIKSLGVKGVIKKKEYVDMDALENAIYHGHINAAELAECQEKKEVVTLRVSKVKS